MADLVDALATAAVGLPIVAALLMAVARTPRQADRLAQITAPLTAGPTLALAAIALARGGRPPLSGTPVALDGPGGVLLAVTAVVGATSVLVSPGYLRTSGRSWLSATTSHARYYIALLAFWAALIAVPLASNLAGGWLIVEGTGGASALLVAYTGRREALEAGWKYLLLTTLGLSVALLGIIALAVAQGRLHHHGLGALDYTTLRAAAPSLPRPAATAALVLLLGGLATKIGWAPVHNWLPDAHSEAPAPVSAMLSAALLPSVLLVAWRTRLVLDPAVGSHTAGAILIAFGLASILVAVPFLWQPLPWKRLLAYSSLEHMGVIALGIGFGTPLAIAGALLHIAGHALAKSLGFYTALPLLRIDRTLSRRPAVAIARVSPRTATAMGVSLGALAALPPSPLFLSELLVLAGGLQRGATVVTVVAAGALALAFVGLLRSGLTGVLGDGDDDHDGRDVGASGGSAGRRRRRPRRAERTIVVLTAVLGVGLIGVAVAGLMLPGSALVAALARGAL